MSNLIHQQSKKNIYFTRPLILLVYSPLFFILLMSSNALVGGRLSPRLFFNGVWNYELLALLTYLVALIWDGVRNRFSDGSKEDTFEFVLKYLVALSIGIVFGIEIIQAFGTDLVFKTLLLEFPRNIPAKFPPILIPSAFILLVVAGFRSSLRQRNERDELERLYQKTKLQALKVQLNPHFLFNALNMISAEIEEDPELATDILDEFAELLRGVLKLSGLDGVPLWQEYELIFHYLKIQEQRFSGRINTSQQLEEECKDYKVPPLLIQPLVENSFVHGFEKTGQGGSIHISARKDGNFLLLEIKDDGQGFEPANVRESIGVTYVREVLKLSYQNRGKLTIQSAPGKGTLCSIQIPREMV